MNTQKEILDSYFKGLFNSGVIGIETALASYEAVRSSPKSFEYAKILVAVITSHLQNMDSACALSEEEDNK